MAPPASLIIVSAASVSGAVILLPFRRILFMFPPVNRPGENRFKAVFVQKTEMSAEQADQVGMNSFHKLAR